MAINPDTLAAAAGLQAGAPASSSVLQTLNRVNQRLDRLLSDLGACSEADVELREIAHQVITALERDPEIALACILLNQIAGRYAVRHCVETAIVAALIARGMRKSPIEVLTLTAAALTMNLGMMRQIESFQARETALTNEERAIVRRHPSESAELLGRAGVTDEGWLAYVLQHHEAGDGSGYPAGLLGDEIPQNAKLIGLADRYCACISARNYRRSMLPPAALDKLCAEAEKTVDSALASQFIEHIGKFPPGTRVRLASGEVGVVSRRASAVREMTVHALRTAEGKNLPQAELRTTSAGNCVIDEALSEDQAGVRFSMKHIWGELASL
jgi:HD-GYP domain-containing protein (c-di-GMP phosphodiesterase class II)